MKGISLPINVIVIVAVAVLVLIVVSAFFVGSVVPGTGAINTEVAYNSGCARLTQVEKCTKEPDQIFLSNYNPTGSPELKNTGDTLLTACRLKFNDKAMSLTACKQSCGCSTAGGGPTPAAPPAAPPAPPPLGTPIAPVVITK